MTLLRNQGRILAAGHPEFLGCEVSDEAGFELGKESGFLAASGYIAPAKRYFTQGRSFGWAMLACFQILGEADEATTGNSAIKIFAGAANLKEAKLVQQLGNLSDAETAELMSFRPGDAFVFAEGFRKAVRTHFPYKDLGPYPSDDEVAARQAQDMAWIAANTIYSPEEDALEPLEYLEILNERIDVVDHADAGTDADDREEIASQVLVEHLELLREIKTHPTAGTIEHYDNLGWSRARASRVKQEAEEMGLITVRVEPSRVGRPREVLLITPLGEQMMEAA